MPPRAGPIPRRPDGQPAWFTEEHNAFLERLLHYPPGAVLDLWQTYLVPAAQLVLRDYAVKPPPAYEQLQGLGIDVGVCVGVGGVAVGRCTLDLAMGRGIWRG